MKNRSSFIRRSLGEGGSPFPLHASRYVIFSGYHNPKFETITEYCEKAIESPGFDLIKFEDRAFVLPGRIRDRFPFLQKWDLARLNRKLIKTAYSVWRIAYSEDKAVSGHRSAVSRGETMFSPSSYALHPLSAKALASAERFTLIVTGGHRILPETIEKIKSMGIKTVLWTIDPPIYFECLKEYAKHYDEIVCGGSEAQELLKGIRDDAKFLPFGCDGYTHKKLELSEEDFEKYKSDICFIGSHYPNREQLFLQLSDFDFAIYGPGWEKISEGNFQGIGNREQGTGGAVGAVNRNLTRVCEYTNNFALCAKTHCKAALEVSFALRSAFGKAEHVRKADPCKKNPESKAISLFVVPFTIGRIRLYSQSVRPDEWLKILSASKMTVVAHYQDGKIPCYQVSPKVYEAMACEVLVLCDRQPDALALFEDKKNIVFYDNAEDLKEKIQYYLDNPQEREKIVAQAKKDVFEKHTYLERMKQLLSA